jgi:hypothetical protein
MLSVSKHGELTVTLCLDKTRAVAPTDWKETVMADPPAYPRAAKDAGEAPPRPRLTARQRAVRVLLIAAVVALVALMITLHAVGVMGPGTHG